MYSVEWAVLKALNDLDSDIYKLFYVDLGLKYLIWIQLEGIKLSCDTIYKNSDNSTDFETNYKSISNHPAMTDDGKPEVKTVITKDGWYFSSPALDFFTSKYNSLYNRKHDGAGIFDGTDVGDAGLKFYDENDDELVKNEQETDEQFQTRLDGNCIKTEMWYEKIEDYQCRGATLYLSKTPTVQAYLWCVFAPDIPYEYGGSKPFMGRGQNLCMMAPLIPHTFEAVSNATISYNAEYHSGKISCIVKHGLGDKIGLQLIFTAYEE